MTARKRVGSRRPSELQYRRTPHLVCHWEKGQIVLHNYASGMRAPATPLAVEILDLCDEWRACSHLERELRTLDGTVLQTVLSALVDHTFLERSNEPPPATSRLFSQWNSWRPAAAFFHASTKDVAFVEPAQADGLLRRKAETQPPPPELKTPRKAGPTIRLFAPRTETGELAETLSARRTWRQFSTTAVSSAHVATLLRLTWGVQQWMHVDGFGRMALKTSPSGGARHSIEVYAYARRVTDLARGWYHYDPDRHALSPLPSRARRHPRISDYLPTQRWYDDAAVLLVMTAVFARAQWRYGYARAYRSILTEAGHLAQTFCLVATSLNLAPFCSMALADSRIERDLGIDGVSESVIYATGVGNRPSGVDWAPWPNTTQTPRVEQPAWKRRKS